MKLNTKTVIFILAAVSFLFLGEMILSNKVPESADMFHRIPLDRWAEDYNSKNDNKLQQLLQNCDQKDLDFAKIYQFYKSYNIIATC